jgi:copper homeostasis protein
MILVEAAIENVSDAVRAVGEGAGRLELCANLGAGGTTPSVELLAEVKAAVPVPVMVMIRPRGGGFVYRDTELHQMLRDIVTLREHGADGVVFGPLNLDGHVDEVQLSLLLRAALPMQTVFHRAIDSVHDVPWSVEVLADRGVTRVLTSGGVSCADSGIPVIAALRHRLGNRIEILPGGGVRSGNAARIVRETGVKQVHVGYPRGTAPGRISDVVRQLQLLSPG